ncbi:MAG: hypothetical protein H6605_00030 [Flavobacteriales bacterium]|nr:hypothetical protein [Flavobacteriales bacterium]
MVRNIKINKNMKKFNFKMVFVLTVYLVVSNNNLMAQWSGSCPATTNCDVGISTTSPTAYFHVSPTYSGGMWPMLYPLILADYNLFGTQVTTFSAYNNGKVGIGTASPTSTCHVVGSTLLQGNTEIQGNTIMKGSLTINDGTANQFKVDNSGFMIARQVDVHLDPIPDYVFHSYFDQDSALYYDSIGLYKSMTLEEVDTFIQINRHLPGIKSATEYQKTGTINIGELQLKMLEKIEELTLYNIQLVKEIQELKKKQIELEKMIIPLSKN